MTSGLDAFNRVVIEKFRRHGGRVVRSSSSSANRPMVLLHHRAARSGIESVTPLGYERGGRGTMLVFGTMGGAPDDPAWCHDLRAHSRVDVEVGQETVPVDAVELHGVDRDAAWALIRSARPGVRKHEQRATRTIPVFRLVPVRA
jgi:deazaflavin-dependent oxidoreductase (nitroreductase family)